MAIYYVDNSYGSDLNPGTFHLPFGTITFALTVMAGGAGGFGSGDTLRIFNRGPSYMEGNFDAPLKLGLTFEPAIWGEWPTINPGGATPAFKHTDYWTIRGVRITNSLLYAITGTSGQHPTRVEDCTFDTCQGAVDDIMYPGWVKRVRISNTNTLRGINITSPDVLVSVVDAYACAFGAVANDNNNGIIEHVTSHICGPTVVGGTAIDGGTKALVRNCIALDNVCDYGIKAHETLACCSYTSNPVLYHTVANFLVAFGLDVYSFEFDPKLLTGMLDPFANRRLKRLSPCIGKGHVSSLPTAPIDATRAQFRGDGPMLLGPSMGAFEAPRAMKSFGR